MKTQLAYLLSVLMTFAPTMGFAAGRIQNEDVKTLSQIQAAGGTAANLINDTKIYVTANGINDQLSNAILNGQLGGGAGGAGGVELLTNPGFESGGVTQGWTATGLTASVVTSGANLIAGNKTAQLVSTAAGQTFTSAALPIKGLANGSCSAQVYYYASTAAWTLSATNGTSTLASVALPISTNASVPTTITFPCGATAASTLQWVLTSTAAGTAYIDNAHLGSPQIYQGLQNGAPVTVTKLLTGSGTYTVPSGATAIRVVLVAGGAGGGGTGTGSNVTGTAGGSTTFGTLSATGGTGGVGGGSGAGSGGGVGGIGGSGTCGALTTCYVANGSSGGTGVGSVSGLTTGGGAGGGSMLGGSGIGGANGSGVGGAAATNTGGGGGGAGGSNTPFASASGGGGGGTVIATISNPASTYSYSIGTGGGGGAATASGGTGGAGAAGQIYIEESYQSIVQQAYLPSNGGLSAGDMTSTAATSCPMGTVAADGSAVSRTAYPALFAALGTAYGAGDGSTTFNVPNQGAWNGSSEWSSYTSTPGVNNETVAAQWRRVGPEMEIRVQGVFTATATSGSMSFTIPSGYTIATGVLPNSSLGGEYGSGQAIHAGGGYHFQVGNMTSTSFSAIFQSTASTTSSAQSSAGFNVPFTWASGDTMTLNAKVPITAWIGASTKACIRTVAASAAPITITGVSTQPAQTITGSVTAAAGQSAFFCNATASNVVVTLPQISTVGSNSLSRQMFCLKKIDTSANTCTFSRSGSDLIDGATTKAISAQYTDVCITEDGTTNWWIK